MSESYLDRRKFIQSMASGVAAAGILSHRSLFPSSSDASFSGSNTSCMQYRSFGKLDWKTSALGFGTMRLPLLKNATADDQVDIPEAIHMIRYAIDHGVNYVDTAFPYHNGKSEEVVGLALKDGYREQVKLATKCPCWLLEKQEDFDKYLDIQLKRLDVSKIDFYLFHALWKDRWDQMKSLKVLELAEKAMVDGRIGSLGFSFHDQLPIFKQIINDYDNWTFALIQYNFMNENVQAGTEGLKYASDKGLGVLIMEPLLGGNITNPPGSIKEIWEQSGKKPADLALRWLWDKPEISLVLSGMTTMGQVEENIASACNSGIGALSKEEYALIDRVKTEYARLPYISCTKCRYCMPCPQGVDIPHNFELYNESMTNPSLSKALYKWHFADANKSTQCIECGLCEQKCPQKIPIIESLKKVSQQFQ